MLKQLIAALSKPSLATATAKPADSSPTKQSNEVRLDELGLKIEYPRLFEDPINKTIMDKPIILNNCEAQTIDESTLSQCLKEEDKSFVNPFTRTIDFQGIHHAKSPEEAGRFILATREVYTENVSLKKQIDQFVENLEQLHYLINQLNKLLCPIDDLASLFENTSPTLVESYIAQQKIERINAIERVKTTIVQILLEYISSTETAIDMYQDMPDRKKKSKESLLTGPNFLQNLLIAEIDQLARAESGDKYLLAIEKVAYYHDLVFKPMDEMTRHLVLARITSIADPSFAFEPETAQTKLSEPEPALILIAEPLTPSDTASKSVAVNPRFSLLTTFGPARAHGFFSMFHYSLPTQRDQSDIISELRSAPSPGNRLGDDVD